MRSNGGEVFSPRIQKQAALRIALVAPKFAPSFFGRNHSLPIINPQSKAASFQGALPLLAALTPSPHTVVIFDENIAPLDISALQDFDIIGLTGMIVQTSRMLEILDELHDFHGHLIVGGPYVSVEPEVFQRRCDVIFVGEADQTWPTYIQNVADGKSHLTAYEQATTTDLTKLPMPKYGDLDCSAYAMASIQYSRGCPFLCEFCDIITIFGRRPRTKTPDQFIEELEHLEALGFSSAILVDDNFIGDKKKALALLDRLAIWQEKNGRRFRFTTEASINLGDDPVLLKAMIAANFTSVFIGIESANLDALEETRKVQNTRGDSMLNKLDRIRDAGLIIFGGFIVGFDSDEKSVFDKQFEFIQQAKIAQALISLLTPIPTTPLFDRLKSEGRLLRDHPECQIIPRNMTPDELIEGFHRLNARLFDPDAYLARIEDNMLALQKNGTIENSFRNIKAGLKPAKMARDFIITARVLSRLLASLFRDGELMDVGGRYFHNYLKWNKNTATRTPLGTYLAYVSDHWHFYKFVKQLRNRSEGVTHSFGG
ncbi:radical SAM protein [Parasedimentitalea marina]|uniref:Radical SAM protein n=2 Tax=Parasedimentitalea marina TaxID=2483033 RepID=A0A3T0N409_9RHOB|nr:radical SAM protein [Parasedimentitalea marina]